MPPEESSSHKRLSMSALIVEDDPEVAREMADILRDEGFKPMIASNGADARAALASGPLAIMILDLSLPDGFGTNLLAELRDREDAPPTLIVSGFALAGLVAAQYGLEVLTKPFVVDHFVRAVHRTVSMDRKPSGGVASG